MAHKLIHEQHWKLFTFFGRCSGLYVHTYELAPNSAAATAWKVWRRLQPNFGRHASQIWTEPAGKVTAARLSGLYDMNTTTVYCDLEKGCVGTYESPGIILYTSIMSALFCLQESIAKTLSIWLHISLSSNLRKVWWKDVELFLIVLYLWHSVGSRQASSILKKTKWTNDMLFVLL